MKYIHVHVYTCICNTKNFTCCIILLLLKQDFAPALAWPTEESLTTTLLWIAPSSFLLVWPGFLPMSLSNVSYNLVPRFLYVFSKGYNRIWYVIYCFSVYINWNARNRVNVTCYRSDVLQAYQIFNSFTKWKVRFIRTCLLHT